MPTRVFSEEEKEDLKLQMLEAGFPLLKEYGMTHTSVSRITEAAGIGVSTFYNFFKSKEAYMYELIQYHRKKLIPTLIGEDVMTGKRKLGREDAAKFLWAMIDEEVSIYAHMTLEDEVKLFDAVPGLLPDIRKESQIADGLFAYLDGVRKNPDYAVIANMIKIFVITAQSRKELHAEGYVRTMEWMVERILDLIFE